MGLVRLALRYGFTEGQVNSKGAASPATRAILKITPDKMPFIAAGNRDPRMVVWK